MRANPTPTHPGGAWRGRGGSPGSWGVGLAWLLVILFICLRPSGDASVAELGLCLVCGDKGLATLFLNVVLYVPLGFALRLASGSWVLPVLAGGFLSLGVEISQLWIPGRHSSISDLVANSTGAVLGAFLAATRSSWYRPGYPSGPGFAAVALILPLTVVPATGFLATPSVPGGETLFAQWAPDHPSMVPFRGRLLSAEVGGLPAPVGALHPSDELARLLSQGAPVAARFEWAPSPDGLAPVFRIVDENREEALLIGVRGTDLVVRPRYVASDVRLDRPEWRFSPGGAHAAPSETLDVEVRVAAGGGHWVDPGTGEDLRVGLTVGRGWSLLRAMDFLPRPVLTGLDLLWLTGLLFPFGWWATSRRLLLFGGSMALTVAGMTPLWTGLLPTPAWEYLALAVGLMVGHTLRAEVERRDLGPSRPTGAGDSRPATVRLVRPR